MDEGIEAGKKVAKSILGLTVSGVHYAIYGNTTLPIDERTYYHELTKGATQLTDSVIDLVALLVELSRKNE